MSTSQPVYLTRAKYTAYLQQLEHMETTGEMKLSELIASSPGSGMGRPLDLPVHNLAREFYAEKETIKAKLRNVFIIEDYVEKIKDYSVVDIGATVTIIDLETEELEVYTILGSDDSSPDEARISFLSPLGAALIGKRKGALVVLPSIDAQFRIERVEYRPLDFIYEPTDWENRIANASV